MGKHPVHIVQSHSDRVIKIKRVKPPFFVASFYLPSLGLSLLETEIPISPAFLSKAKAFAKSHIYLSK
jgi:hypothetical protein